MSIVWFCLHVLHVLQVLHVLHVLHDRNAQCFLSYAPSDPTPLLEAIKLQMKAKAYGQTKTKL